MTETAPPRIRAGEDDLVPRVLIRATLALVCATLALVTVARLTDRPLDAMPSSAPVIAERVIYISSGADGAARILDETGTVLAAFDRDKGGFVAGIDRVLRRERAKARLPESGPAMLRLRAGHTLSISDPQTGFSAELIGFGADNLRTFARLLEASPAPAADQEGS